jgi:hypothetical protein
MVFHDRPIYQEEHAAQPIMPSRTLLSIQRPNTFAQIRRSVFAFPLQSCNGPYIGGLRRLVGSSVSRVVFQLPIILPHRRLQLTRVVEPETLAQPVRIPYGRNSSVDAISRAERGEAKVFPVPIVIVEEADARVSRSPRSIRSKSATGSSCVRCPQDLLAIL